VKEILLWYDAQTDFLEYFTKLSPLMAALLFSLSYLRSALLTDAQSFVEVLIKSCVKMQSHG
jgi:hypothetical protein